MNKKELRGATILVLCLSFLVSLSVSAQSDAVKKIIEMGTTDNQVMNHLDILTNRFGGRLVGSAAFENASEWVMRQFESYGLDVRQEEAGEVSVGFNRGAWFGRLIGGDEAMTLHFVTPSYTSGTHGLQRGHVLIEPKTQKELDKMKHALKGAWVLIGGKSTGFPINRTAKGDSIREAVKAENAAIEKENQDLMRQAFASGKMPNRDDMKPLREEPGLYYKEMIEAGVLGFIQSAEVPLRALYDRQMLNEGTTTFDDLPTVPEIKLDEHQYAIIEQMAKERREFQLEFDIRNYFKIGPVKYHNIIGTLKGSKYPDEYVIISAHLDSYDSASGAVDCGTGMGPLLEAARLITQSGAKPKRTILFIAFAAEEFGLYGAQAYAKQHKNELGKISNMFNRDGGPLPPVGIEVPQAMYDDFVKICEPVKDINPDFPFEVTVMRPRPRPTRLGGTDASVFAIEGVPTLGFREEDIKGYNFDYQEIWHTERDRFDHEIPEYQEQAAVVTAVVALGVANLDHQLSRDGLYSEGPGPGPEGPR